MEIKAEHMVEEGLRDRSGFILETIVLVYKY
jgi:hypothetical protein